MLDRRIPVLLSSSTRTLVPSVVVPLLLPLSLPLPLPPLLCLSSLGSGLGGGSAAPLNAMLGLGLPPWTP